MELLNNSSVKPIAELTHSTVTYVINFLMYIYNVYIYIMYVYIYIYILCERDSVIYFGDFSWINMENGKFIRD